VLIWRELPRAASCRGPTIAVGPKPAGVEEISNDVV
jgi:hypothetical protein